MQTAFHYNWGILWGWGLPLYCSCSLIIILIENIREMLLVEFFLLWRRLVHLRFSIFSKNLNGVLDESWRNIMLLIASQNIFHQQHSKRISNIWSHSMKIFRNLLNILSNKFYECLRLLRKRYKFYDPIKIL